jgi:hypothetical protein
MRARSRWYGAAPGSVLSCAAADRGYMLRCGRLAPTPPSATSSSARPAKPASPTSPTPAAAAHATTSESRPSTGTRKQTPRASGHITPTRRGRGHGATGRPVSLNAASALRPPAFWPGDVADFSRVKPKARGHELHRIYVKYRNLHVVYTIVAFRLAVPRRGSPSELAYMRVAHSTWGVSSCFRVVLLPGCPAACRMPGLP